MAWRARARAEECGLSDEFDEDAFLPSPAADAAPPAQHDDEWVASHCGACFKEAETFAHACYLRNVDEEHVVPLCSAMLCTSVVMPIEGYYFCSMACLHAYNSKKEMHDIVELMPDDFA